MGSLRHSLGKFVGLGCHSCIARASALTTIRERRALYSRLRTKLSKEPLLKIYQALLGVTEVPLRERVGLGAGSRHGDIRGLRTEGRESS